jgi:predicted ATPase
LRALAAAQGFAELLASATRSHGLARVEQGQIAEGIAQMHQGMADLQVLRTVVGKATQLAHLAKMYGHAGQPEEGLRLLNTAMTARQDTEERFDEVGRFRPKGELLLLLPHPDRRQAASCFRQALAIARSQQAKSLELRTTLRLSHLWQQQGKRDQARQLLAQSYGWFTEGFDTPDLQEAKALLQQL